MKCGLVLALLATCTFAQTQKPLTNAEIVAMTKQGFEATLIIKDIESSSTSFDISPQALIELKNAGVSQSVMEAMLAAQAKSLRPVLRRLTAPWRQKARQQIHQSTGATLIRAAYSEMASRLP